MKWEGRGVRCYYGLRFNIWSLKFFKLDFISVLELIEFREVFLGWLILWEVKIIN